jgi:hypothetical protein
MGQHMLDTSRFAIPFNRTRDTLEHYALMYPSRRANRYGGVTVPGPFGVNAYARPTLDGSELVTEVCVPRYLFGHNTFGSSDVYGQLKEVVGWLEDAFGLEGELLDVFDQVTLHRIDLVINLTLDAGISPADVLDALHDVLRGAGCSLCVYERFGNVESLYRNPRKYGERSLFYDKSRHLRAASAAIARSVEHTERIKKYASSVLRYESRWSWSQLRKPGQDLFQITAWTPSLARRLVSDRLDRAVDKVTGCVPAKTESPASISRRLRNILALHADGARLRKCFDPRTFRRLRKELYTATGIDLYRSPGKRLGMSLESLFTEQERRRYGRPRWASEPYQLLLANAQ